MDGFIKENFKMDKKLEEAYYQKKKKKDKLAMKLMTFNWKVTYQIKNLLILFKGKEN